MLFESTAGPGIHAMQSIPLRTFDPHRQVLAILKARSH